MNSILRFLLRLVAILIGIAALIDPAWSIGRPLPRQLVLIDATSGAASGIAGAIGKAAPDWRVVTRPAASRRLPCDPDERCVVASDGSVDVDVPQDLRVPLSLVDLSNAVAPNVRLRSVVVPAANVAAAGSVKVEVSRTGSVDASDVRVLDGAAVVGFATIAWGTDTTTTIDVPWWPIEPGGRRLRVEVVPFDGETSTIDNHVDIGVAVGDTRTPVLVFDARPSWSSTFVRRSLEDDPRFDVSYRARVAPSLSAGTRRGVLDAATLEAVPVVIAGGPDALTAADVALLERFVIVRGGTLILLPEHRVSGPVERLLPGAWTEHLVPAAEHVGPLRATEILRTAEAPVGSVVLGRSGTAASIVAMPLGAGRVVISGAMDAWRHRHLDASTSLRAGTPAFDRFWRSAVAEGAIAGGALRLDLSSPIAAGGDRVPFTLRHRSLEARSALEAAVTARCDDRDVVPVRVWPAGAINTFAGELSIDGRAHCAIQVSLADRVASTTIAVADRFAPGVELTLAKLKRAAPASGGVVTSAGDEAAIARALPATPSATSQIVSVHPLRPAWWMLPFAACLSAEWWLRRRAGLR